MAYRYSNIDRNNLRWMGADNTCATLATIQLTVGSLRGLSPFRMDLSYPISAIAGENGSGKSTLLAIAACGYHNQKDGYKLIDRANPYYTFSDFFIQSNDEIPPQGIRIRYQFRNDNWHRSEPGLAWQSRRKKEGGRWNDYNNRIKRNLVYFGIQRVVPHYERSAHKSYRGRFRIGTLDEDVRDSIREIASRILGKPYSEYEIHKHSKYSLPIARCEGVRYSGFNMGAGESAVFEILTALFESGRGTLLVIDEIELGLHEKAQRRLINELKILCQNMHCQVICSTHSHIVLGELPPEGRFYIEGANGSTRIIPGISADHACGKLAGINAGEIDVFVEDGAARSILEVGVPLSVRERIRVIPIGSSEAVLRQLSSRYLEQQDSCLIILDGDKRNEQNDILRRVRENVETRYRESEDEINKWVRDRLDFLPGNTWPERWILETAQGLANKDYLFEHWDMEDINRVDQSLANALLAGKHNEFYTLQSEVQQPLTQVRADVIRFVKQGQPDVFGGVTNKITSMLEENA